MIYVVQNYKHYLLANKFVFFTDHQALLYLVKKPCNMDRIVRWFLILLKFDFIFLVKQGKTHLRANHLSRMIHGEKPTGIDDNLPDAYLLNMEMVPKWFEPLVSMLTIETLHNQPSHVVEQ